MSGFSSEAACAEYLRRVRWREGFNVIRSRTKGWWAARKNWTPTYRYNKNEVDIPFSQISTPGCPLIILVQASQHLWPVHTHDIYRQFPELSSPHGALSQPKAEGFIVSRASHKAVTIDACRGRKLLAIQQADSKISNIIRDFKSQRMLGGVGRGGE